MRAADQDRAVIGVFRDCARRPDLDLVQGEAALPRLGAQPVSMAIVEVEPAQVQGLYFHRGAELLKGVDVDRHDRVPPCRLGRRYLAGTKFTGYQPIQA